MSVKSVSVVNTKQAVKGLSISELKFNKVYKILSVKSGCYNPDWVGCFVIKTSNCNDNKLIVISSPENCITQYFGEQLDFAGYTFEPVEVEITVKVLS